MPAFATLINLKLWLGITTPTDDVLLTVLINQISVAILEYTQRPDFILTTFNEMRSGTGNQRLLLRNWPVVAINSLVIGNTNIPKAASYGQSGYIIETWDGTSGATPQVLYLRGYCFTRAWDNIVINYKAGYSVQNEAHAIVARIVTANQTYGMWTQDDGVTYANGTAFVKVASTPTQGQYTVSSGVYGFNTADNNQAILINYSYVPAPITQACMEWVGERYRYKERIGEATRSLGGAMSAGYNLKLPDHIAMMLDPYKKYIPL